MAKQFVLYNLKDDRKEEDYIKWVNEFKGPFIIGLSAVTRYTLTTVKKAMQAKGGPPGPVESPFKYAAIVELTSLQDYVKDTETRPYKEEFLPQFMAWVKDFLILQADEFYDKESS